MKFLYFIIAFCLTFTSVQAATTEELLLTLAKRARESQSDSVLIIHNGRPIFEYCSDSKWQPIEVMAITQSIVALAIGKLIDEGLIQSIDAPIYQFYPEWDQGNKRLITIRHLLSHTSGLQAEPFSLDEVHKAPDSIQLALCAELSGPPGTCFFYNSKATNLLSGIIEKASGVSLSEYTKQKIFDPLEIENVSWQCDAAHHDYAMAHLAITAPDLAKIGDLVCSGGLWHGQRLISQKWMDQITTPGQGSNPFCGHLWWLDYYSVQCCWEDSLLKQYEMSGIAPEYVRRLRALQGQVIPVTDRVKPALGCISCSQALMVYFGGKKEALEFSSQVTAKMLPTTSWLASGVKSYIAYGKYGQQLIIFPKKNVVAVRQARLKAHPESPDPNNVDIFGDFAALVEQYIHCQRY